MATLGVQRIRENPVQHNLHHGLPAVGTWLTLCSPAAAEQMAHVGWDWLVVDVEHSPVGFETMVNCFRATQLGGAVPLARVPWNDTVWIQRTLDAGAFGLVVPMVNSARDAEEAVANTRYATAGQRSFGGTRIRDYIVGDYFEWAAENISVIVMIESIEAVEHADEILSVDGVDCGYIGPSDLARSMGINPNQGGPGTAHEDAMLHVVQVGKQVGTAVGKHCADVAEVNLRIEQGFQFLAAASEARFMVAEAQRQFAELKRPAR